MITEPLQRIGEPYLHVDPGKVVAVIETDSPDRNAPFNPPDDTSRAIADHLVDFLRHEVRIGRMPPGLLPIQSGVGNVANAVLAGLDDSEFIDLVAFTEVLQDGMLDLLDSGTLRETSATSFGLSSDGVRRFVAGIDDYKGRILLRSEEISNHPELVRRLGVLAMNGMIEADILRQRELHPRHGQRHHERHRRQRGLRAQRILQLFLVAVDGQGWCHLGDRPDGQPRRPH